MDLNLYNNAFSNVRMELIQATKDGNLLRIKQLLEEGADIGAVDRLGYTALHWSTIKNNPDIARLLLNAGAHPTNSVFMSAVWGNQMRLVQLLLEAGADVYAKDHSDWTAFTLASKKSFVDMCVLLLRYGAPICPGDMSQLTTHSRRALLSIWSWNKRSSMVSLRNHLLNLED